jgi:hypothetical protein
MGKGQGSLLPTLEWRGSLPAVLLASRGGPPSALPGRRTRTATLHAYVRRAPASPIPSHHPAPQAGPCSSPFLRAEARLAAVKHKIYSHINEIYSGYLCPPRAYVLASPRHRELVAGLHPADREALPFDWGAPSFDWLGYLSAPFDKGVLVHGAEEFELTRNGFLTRAQRVQLACATLVWGVQYVARALLAAARALAGERRSKE